MAAPAEDAASAAPTDGAGAGGDDAGVAAGAAATDEQVMSGEMPRPAALSTASSAGTPAEEWPANSEAYSLDCRIGRGAFSDVYRATVIAGGAQQSTAVAVKIMDLEHVATSIDDILSEVRTMRLSSHRNLLSCLCSFMERDRLWIVTQLMDKGSCLRVMNKAKKAGLGEGMNEEWIAYILRETLLGLQYLHDNDRIHRDVKAGNILLNTNADVTLADFGVSGWLVQHGNRKRGVRTFVGTPCWMAPEVMEQVDGYDEKADIWSLGITALELAKGFAPYAHYPPMKVLVKTIEDEPPSLRNYGNDRQRTGAPFSSNFRSFVAACLNKDAKRRPTCADLLAMRVFKRTDPTSLREELLSNIEPVGAGPPEEGERPPGAAPMSLERNVTGGAAGTAAAAVEQQASEQDTITVGTGQNARVVVAAPVGTTWVFDEGSQVLRKGGDAEVSEQATAAAAASEPAPGTEASAIRKETDPDDNLNEDFDEFDEITDEKFKTTAEMRAEEEKKVLQEDMDDMLADGIGDDAA